MEKKLLERISSTLSSSLNIVITNPNNEITYASESLCNLMGYSQDELIGKNPSFLKHPSTTKFIMDNMWHGLGKKNHWNGILKNRKKDGTEVYINADIFKDYDEDGNHIGYHSIHTDISSAVKNPHKFIFDNELFNLFFSDTDDLIAVCLCKSETNDIQRILEISNKLAVLVGIPKTEILNKGLSFTDILSTQSKYFHNIDKLVEDYNNNKEIIVKFDSKKGMRQCRLSITPFEYQGNPSKIFKLTDITEELNYSQQLAEINESKNNFLANFSHEIRTPLNATIGFLTLLQLRETDREKLDFIKLILDNSTHLLDLMNDVIDFTSIDNKKLEIVEREFTPRDIQSTIEIFYAKSLEKQIEFSVYISPQLPDLMKQDILRIKQVISNLISNAVKFVDVNGKITIETHYYAGNLYFTIQDNGIGMTQEQLKKVFKPFQQADKDTKLLYGGTGLGLSVVNDIVKMMGGDITVESEKGKGSTFTVRFPVEVIKARKLLGKLDINTIKIYAPSFSSDKIKILTKYFIHFSTAKVQVLENLKNIKDTVLVVYLDDTSIETITKLSKKNKIVVIKNMNDVIHDFDESDNIIEINMPIMGSKLFDTLNSLINNISLDPIGIDSSFDLKIKGKILVADDLESNRILIRELLTKYDIKLDIVNNGQEAIDYYKKSIKNNISNYDIILLDMNMPIISGSRAAAKIRDFEQQLSIERTPIIALTANRYYNINDEAALVNMDEYISKPINLKQLLGTIVKYTSNLEYKSMYSNNDKITKLKEIRDNFLNGSKFVDMLIYDSKDFFSDEEYELLHDIIQHKTNKRKFNSIYNTIMKLIRKNS